MLVTAELRARESRRVTYEDDLGSPRYLMEVEGCLVASDLIHMEEAVLKVVEHDGQILRHLLQLPDQLIPCHDFTVHLESTVYRYVG